jgi:type IV secretion system protein TrbL
VPAAADPPTIGGAQGVGTGSKRLEEAIDNLAKHLGQPPRKPTLGERLGDANRHLSQEQAAVHVSINPHHHD